MKKIRIRVAGNGKLQLDYTGFSGRTCYKAGRELHEALKRLGVKLDEGQCTDKPAEDTPAHEQLHQH